MPEKIGNMLITTSLMATGFGGPTLQADPSTNNIRVKLPDKDDDDFSEGDKEEKEMEETERMKIKLEAQLRYDRMAKNKLKGKTTGAAGGPSNTNSTGVLPPGSASKKNR